MINNHDGVGQVSKDSLTVFKFESSAVRVVTDDKGDPWFCAKDVCTVLGYTNDSKAVKDHCKPWGITKRYLPTSSGPQELTFINEGNVYRLGIIRSYKPEAKRFEYWVYDEVLPSIRKTGSYSLHTPQIPQTYPEALRLGADEMEKRLLAEAKVLEITPKAEYHDKAREAENCHDFKEAAKIL
jgi:prophage antirepressor-like protein